ncbi:MAG: HAMP domain-containing sensor histidine kinase [Bacillota bacterium]|nr:HAMP domain-containing sensor histidine kinase [Bacillota bacterium]
MKKKGSLFVKNFTTYAAVILLGFIVLAVSFVLIADRYSTAEKMEALDKVAQRASNTTAVIINNYSPAIESLYELSMAQMAGDAGATIVICDVTGKISYIADSDGCYPQRYIEAYPSAFSQLVRNGSYTEKGTFGGLFSDKRYIIGLPVMNVSTGGYSGAVFAAAPVASNINMLQDVFGAFLAALLSVLLVTLILSYLITARLTRPLKTMANAAVSFARGDFTMRVPEALRNDEVGELAVSFNNMAASMQSLEEQRRDFIANVSHDLKTPMTTIAGFVDGMLDGTVPREKYNEYLKVISEEVKRLSRMANRMLDMAKFESGAIVINKITFDVCELASRIILSFEQVLNARNVEVIVSMPSELKILADKDAMAQVIYNLVDNAVKFVDDKGRLSMSIAAVGNLMHFKISNTGAEIPMADQQHIFERFYKVDRSRNLNRQGSGLGLYIVKTIINLHGGDIKVKSGNNETEFYFKFPIS